MPEFIPKDFGIKSNLIDSMSLKQRKKLLGLISHSIYQPASPLINQQFFVGERQAIKEALRKKHFSEK